MFGGKLSLLTIGLVILIVVVCIWCNNYVNKNKEELNKKKRFIEQFPSAVSTLGVLGTFLGITIGLLGFDTDNVEHSIPILLNGLSTAFFTSLAGMICSLILSNKINKLFDKDNDTVSDAVTAANIVVNAVQSIEETYKNSSDAMSKTYVAIVNFVNSIDSKVSNMDTSITSIGTNLLTMNSRVSNMENHLSAINRNSISLNESIVNIGNVEQHIDKTVDSIQKLSSHMDETLVSIPKAIGKVEEEVKAVNTSMNDFDTHVSSEFANVKNMMSDHSQKMNNGIGLINQEVTKLNNMLPKEVKDIQKSMMETNALLEKKFKEFTELLKKSNTEALVEVMKKVTEEFNKQMSALINKLIQENFEQLNKSVEQLNTWQMENKEMIAELTDKYKQMTIAFGETSNTLQLVGGETEALVGNESKLSQLVKVLSKVMVDDDRFVNITENLSSSAALTRDSMVKFHDEVSILNDWVNKQRNFTEAVEVLITRLDEINKINDYGEEFWKETRKGMNDSVKIIKNGVKSLQEGISDLDAHFYDCLNKTLANLDSCIAAFVPTKRKE